MHTVHFCNLMSSCKKDLHHSLIVQAGMAFNGAIPQQQAATNSSERSTCKSSSLFKCMLKVSQAPEANIAKSMRYLHYLLAAKSGKYWFPAAWPTALFCTHTVQLLAGSALLLCHPWPSCPDSVRAVRADTDCTCHTVALTMLVRETQSTLNGVCRTVVVTG